MNTRQGGVVVHVTAPGGLGALCGAVDGELVLWVEATRPGGEHFTCAACYKALTGERKHVKPPDTVEVLVDDEWTDVTSFRDTDG